MLEQVISKETDKLCLSYNKQFLFHKMAVAFEQLHNK